MPIHYTQHGFVGLVEGVESVPVAELVAFLDDLAANDAARAVVLVLPSPPGSLSREPHGQDAPQTSLPSPGGSGEGSRVRAYGPDDLEALALTPLPTIAVLTGALDGLVYLLASACDIRLCDETTTFPAGADLPHTLRPLLQRSQDRRLPSPAGSGEGQGVRAESPATADLDASSAFLEGLVSEVAPPGQALTRALSLAETIASRGPIATRLAKEALWRGRAMPLAQALRFETDLTLLLQTTKDRAEGVSAFIEKRKPTFTGNYHT